MCKWDSSVKSGNIYETIWFDCFHNFLMCFIVCGISSQRPLDLNLWDAWRSVPDVNVTSVRYVRFHLEHVTFRVFALLNHISKMFPGRCYNNIQPIYFLNSLAFLRCLYTNMTVNTQCCPDDVRSLGLLGDVSFTHKWTSKFKFLKQVVISKNSKACSSY